MILFGGYMFKNLTAHPTNTPHLLKITGDLNEIKKLKDKLTITNKSVSYQIKASIDRMGFWKSRESGEIDASGAASPYTLDKISSLSNEIKELKERLEEKYYIETGGDLFIPSGLWYLVGSVHGDCHLDTEINNVHILGYAREYQRELITEMLKYKRATGVLATGLGKGVCITSLAISAAKSGKRTCVVVPTEYLVGQLSEEIKEHHESVTAAGGKRHAALGKDILVTTAQSAIKYIDNYDVVIIDEAHRESAKTWQDLLTASDKVTHVWNLTATPFRADGLDLGIHALGGPVVYERGVRWGIQNGWLVEPRVFCVAVQTGKRLKASTLQTSAYKQLMNNKNVFEYLRTQLCAATNKGRRSMVLFKTLSVAKNFKKYCKGVLDFDVADAMYKKPLNDFRDGKVQVLVATDKLVSEGINIPNCDCLFLLTQHSSDVITYQSAGRVLRTAKNKTEAIIVDISVIGYESFERSAIKRRGVFTQMTNNIKLVTYGGV